MNEAQWEKFFDLLRLITELNMPHTQKKELVLEKAKQLSGDMDLEEFHCWFDESDF